MKKRSWISRLSGPVGLSIFFIFGLGCCFIFSGFIVNLFQTRTQASSLVPLKIPTISATDVPTAEQLDFAATVTVEFDPTDLSGQTSANFDIAFVEKAIVFLPNGSATFKNGWDEIEGIIPIHIVEQEASWDGSQDVTARWKLAYDEDALYGLVDVQDDVIVQTETARTAYLGDSLEMEIDGLNDKADAAQPDDFQFVISPGDFDGISAEIFRFRGNNGSMADDPGNDNNIISSITGDGYSIAFRIPWVDMALLGPPAQVGIALSVNDNDSPGTAQQELMLSTAATRRWAAPSSWGTATLDE